MGVAASFFMMAQNASVITNTSEVYGNQSLNGSAKYNAMAGSTGALGGDGNALLNNPAGLGVAINGSLAATLGIENYKNNSTLNGSSIGYTNTEGNITNLNGVAAFQLMTETAWKFVNIGVNYSSRSLDNYVETAGNNNIVISKALIDQNGNAVTGEMTYEGHAYNRTGQQSKMAFGVGANYNNAVYFGAGLNFHSANLEQYDSAVFHLNLDNTRAEYSKQYTPFSEQGSGFSANIGVIGKLGNQIRLGAALETPTWWSVERVYADHYEDTSGYISYEYLNETRTLRSPMKATLSAALVPNKNFSANIDYTVALGKPHYKVEGPAETELNDFFSENSKNMSEIKVGAEYRISGFRLRGGFAHASNPFNAMNISAYDDNGTASDRSFDDLFAGNRSTIGLGLGYDWRSFFIDAAFQHMTSNYESAFLRGSQTAGSGYYSGDFDVTTPNYVVSHVTKIQNNFFLTAGWKF